MRTAHALIYQPVEERGVAAAAQVAVAHHHIADHQGVFLIELLKALGVLLADHALVGLDLLRILQDAAMMIDGKDAEAMRELHPLLGSLDRDDLLPQLLEGDVYGSTCSFGLPVQTIYPKVLDLSSELGQKIKAAHAESTGDDSTFLADTSVLYFNMTNTLNNVTVAGYIRLELSLSTIEISRCFSPSTFGRI